MAAKSENGITDLVLRALELPAHEQRAFLESACAEDPDRLEAAWRWLRAEDDLGDFLEKPASDGLAGLGTGDLRDLTAESSSEELTIDEGSLRQRSGPRGLARARAGQVPGEGPGEAPAASHPESTGAIGAAETLWDSAVSSSAGKRSTADDLASGGWRFPSGEQRLGVYPIVDHIGEGGMGQIYIGQDARLGRKIAIKVLPPEMATRPGWLERFEREARALATLNHPNIVTIHSIEEDSGVRFLTMELIEGETLGSQIPESGLALETFLDIAIEIADALAAAHEQGVVHRDLKPANVMVTKSGRAKILDFGIAQVQSPDGPNLSREGTAIGTLAYMAPEQVQGLKVDARSDLFSLGIVMYRMASGEHPFPAKNFTDRINAILTIDPPPLLARRPDLPAELERLIERCLEKDPVNRYQSSEALRHNLLRLRQDHLAERLLESRTDLAPLAPLTAPPPRRWFFAVGALLILLASTATWFASRKTATITQASAATPVERQTLAVAPFRNLTGQEELDWLREGIAELLITDLAQSPELEVVAESRQDEAEVILRGSFAQLGEVLRLAISLERLEGGEVLLARSVDGEGSESIFKLVDQVSSGLRNLLDATLPEIAPESVEATTTGSVAAWQAYLKARRLYKDSQIDEAIAETEMAVELDPEFALAYMRLAKLHHSLGHVDQAEEYSAKALALGEQRLPLDQRFDAEAVHYGTRWSTIARAIETYLLALKVYPEESPGVRNNLARRYAFIERYSDAIVEFERLIGEGHDYWGNYYGAANSYAALGDFETGESLLQGFAERHPDHWLIRYSLAWHLTEWGRYPESLKVFEEVARLRPGTVQVYYGRWRLSVLSGDLVGAQTEATSLLDLEDAFGTWRGHVSLARNALYQGAAAIAEHHFEQAVAQSTGPDRALAHCFLAELLLRLNRASEARDAARSAQNEGVGQWPELQGLFFEALAEQALGRGEEADNLAETLRARWRRQPNVVEERQIYQLEGLLELARGDTESAAKSLARSAALLPTRGIEFSWHVFPPHVPIWTALGEAEMAAGRPDAARDWLALSSASGSEHLEQPLAWVHGLYLEGLARYRAGEVDEAKVLFERFLSYWGEGEIEEEAVELARSFLADRQD